MADGATAAELPMCSFCLKPVALEAAKTDEDGQAVHEDCYSARLIKEMQAANSQKRS